jgi:hypothetical protein
MCALFLPSRTAAAWLVVVALLILVANSTLGYATTNAALVTTVISCATTTGANPITEHGAEVMVASRHVLWSRWILTELQP